MHSHVLENNHPPPTKVEEEKISERFRLDPFSTNTYFIFNSKKKYVPVNAKLFVVTYLYPNLIHSCFRWKQEFDEKKDDKDNDNSNQTSINQKTKLSELNSELSLTDEERSLFRWKKQFDEKKNNNKGNPSSNDTQSKETKEHGIVK